MPTLIRFNVEWKKTNLHYICNHFLLPGFSHIQAQEIFLFIKSADTNKCIDLSCKGNTDSLPYYLGLIVFLCLVTHQKNKKTCNGWHHLYTVNVYSRYSSTDHGKQSSGCHKVVFLVFIPLGNVISWSPRFLSTNAKSSLEHLWDVSDAQRPHTSTFRARSTGCQIPGVCPCLDRSELNWRHSWMCTKVAKHCSIKMSDIFWRMVHQIWNMLYLVLLLFINKDLVL